MSFPDGAKVFDYKRKDGSVPFAKWFKSLGVQARAKVDVAIARLKKGNFSNVKTLGQGVSECKINFGPGYRVYFGKEGEKLLYFLAVGKRESRIRIFKLPRDFGKSINQESERVK